jgi:flagellar biosynthesis/type III secretory pathway M-ring protein FliF/YscJ
VELISSTNVIALVVAVVAFLGVRNLIFKFIAGQAHKRFEDAAKKDQELKNEISKLEAEAAKSEGRSQKIEEKIKNTNEDTVSEDWHKTWRPKK